MFQVCFLFEFRADLLALLAQWPLNQGWRSSLHLRLRLIGKEGIYHTVLRLKSLDEGLAFIRNFHSEFWLFEGRSFFSEKVTSNFFGLLARLSAPLRSGGVSGRRPRLSGRRYCAIHH